MDENTLLPSDLPAQEGRRRLRWRADHLGRRGDAACSSGAASRHRRPTRPGDPDERNADRVVHLLPDILRARIFAIACGYEDADDLDRLRFDPAPKLACGRLPDTGRDLCSQPTVSRWENAPNLRDLIRLMDVMVDLYCASYPKPPDAVTLDIDDAVDVGDGLAAGGRWIRILGPPLEKHFFETTPEPGN